VADWSSLHPSFVDLVERAGRIAQQAKLALETTIKPDGSLQTSGDRAVEQFLRQELPSLVPDAGIWGEEEGYDIPGPGGLWVVDPIDGTSNYAYGSPLWGVSVALVRDGRIAAGAIALPDLGETFEAYAGGGARRNGVLLPPIPTGPVRPEELVGRNARLRLRYPHVSWPGKGRYNGSFVIEACWVASQRLRGLIDDSCKLYDLAAGLIICSEAGAEIRYADGSPFEVDELLADVCVPQPLLVFPRDSGFFADI
jgi:fructose-1,6-bisphosphatase/inositol monophosphatase family enzyme